MVVQNWLYSEALSQDITEISRKSILDAEIVEILLHVRTS